MTSEVCVDMEITSIHFTVLQPPDFHHIHKKCNPRCCSQGPRHLVENTYISIDTDSLRQMTLRSLGEVENSALQGRVVFLAVRDGGV